MSNSYLWLAVTLLDHTDTASLPWPQKVLADRVASVAYEAHKVWSSPTSLISLSGTFCHTYSPLAPAVTSISQKYPTLLTWDSPKLCSPLTYDPLGCLLHVLHFPIPHKLKFTQRYAKLTILTIISQYCLTAFSWHLRSMWHLYVAVLCNITHAATG